ncbi:MAG: helix-turn-helix domain-containing protein [Rhizobiaceae bacterium]|nr:helix-turn-helix domain-containing protein [Rhizobiaceae bacterium]
MDKRDVADMFRMRLATLTARSGENLSQLAAGIGVDRSALSQMLSPGATRLPRAETLIRLARRHDVSLDWLMGLSEDETLTASLSPALEIEQASADGYDPALAQWHAEAAGTKIRYVPAALPDLLRTEEVAAFDAVRFGLRAETEISGTRDRVDYNRRPETDTEVCMPLQMLDLFARGAGVWEGLAEPVRRRQLVHMAALVDELYPTFRLFLFDARRHFSAPFTVFGTRRAAVYLGDRYLVLNSRDAVAEMARRFDHLVRSASVHAHEAAAHCVALAKAGG